MENTFRATHAYAADPLFWAREPKSAHAVRLLVRGSTTWHRLAQILAEHIANGGASCRSSEAAEAIRALPRPPILEAPEPVPEQAEEVAA